MVRLLVSRQDPHSVYARIFPHIGGLFLAKLIPRVGIAFTSKYYFVRLILLILGDVGAGLRCVFERNNLIIVREFSAWIWIFIGPFVRLLKPGADISLNINHNLNNCVEREILLPILSKIFNLVFIEPTQDMLAKHRWLTALRIHPPVRKLLDKPERAFFFLGSRDEQILVSDDDLKRITGGIPKNISCYVSGGAGKDRLAEDLFEHIFNTGSIIFVLYNPLFYSERHSGVVLEALVAGCDLYMFESKLANEYRIRGFNVVTVVGIDELEHLVACRFMEAAR